MRTKKLLSLLLVLALFITGAFASMITSGATLLNIKEVRATLTLSGYTQSQLKSMPLRTVLDNIVCDGGAYTLGESIDSNPGAKIVWTRYKDESGSEIYDEYHVEDLDAVVDMSVYGDFYHYDANDNSYYSYSSMQVIVGSGNQLDFQNVRYNVSIEFRNIIAELSIEDIDIRFEKTDEYDGVHIGWVEYPRSQMIIVNEDKTKIGYESRDIYVTNYDNKSDGERYIALKVKLANSDSYVRVYSDYTRSEDITDKILAYDTISNTGIGLKIDEYCYSSILFDVYRNEKIIYSEIINLIVQDYCPSLYISNIVDKSGKSVINQDSYNYSYDGHRIYDLYKGYSKSNIYTLKFSSISSDIERIVEGEFSTVEEVLSRPNLLEAFKNGTYGGVFSEPNVYTLYSKMDSSTYIGYFTVELRESTIPEEWWTELPLDNDPLMDVWGVYKADSTSINDFVARGTEFDTYYAYGYQTAFISDDVDMSKIKLLVYGDMRDNVYDSVGSQKIDFSEPQDFTSGKVQYTISTGSKIRNYFVSILKTRTGGAKLYVNGPTDRTVNLDDYFENRHDILIANIGDAELTGLNVEWSVAPQNVKLHDYWTVGGENNDTLAPLTNAASTDYLAKIRLIPDGEGEIRGQLKISADGQEPVYINVSGRAGNPNIVTQSPLKDAVKYVPYSAIIATDNIYSWAHPSFYCSGKLPEGLEFNEKTGEIYGVPTEIGSFKFEVSAQFEDSRGSHLGFPTATKEFELEVLDNTDMNVYNASDDEYTIKTHLGAEQTAGQHDYYLSYESVYSDQVFASNGEFGDFIDLWLNGEKLTEGKDYTKHEGSTVITIKSQTLSDLKRDTSNTIAAEFRVDGKRENELKRTAQNFIIGNVSSKPTEPTDPTEPTNPTTPTNPTNGSTSGNTEKSDSEVKKVIELIEQLPDEITENDADDVDAARRAYDNLTDEQKKQVNNYSKLVDAEKQLDEVKTDEQTPSDENDSTDGEFDSNTDSVKSIGIFGTIYDENGNAISDLSVEIHSEIRKTTTDDSGTFKFDEVEIGKHTLYINGKNGSVSKSFSIEEGDEFIISDDSITFSDEKMVELRIVFDGSSIRFLKNDEEIPTVTQVVVGKDGNPTTAAAFPVVSVIVSGCLAFGALCFRKRK